MKQLLPFGAYKGALPRRNVAMRGDISADRDRRYTLWQTVGGETYVTCLFCGAINRITDHLMGNGHSNIMSDGTIRDHCVTCIHCLGHNITQLIGWDGLSFRVCCLCSRAVDGLAKELSSWPRGFCPVCEKGLKTSKLFVSP